MSSDTPAAQPANAAAVRFPEGDSLETLHAIAVALPFLQTAAGPFAALVANGLETGDDRLIKEIKKQAAGPQGEAYPALEACGPYLEALTRKKAIIKALLAEADAADRGAVVTAAVAVASRSRICNNLYQTLPERAEALVLIDNALNPPTPSADWMADRGALMAKVTEARGESNNTAPWICLYTYDREDGGPEEGGWAYDWHEPIAAWRTADYSDPRDAWSTAEAYAKSLGLILDSTPNAQPASNINPRNRVNAWISYSAFPFARVSIERPHYE